MFGMDSIRFGARPAPTLDSGSLLSPVFADVVERLQSALRRRERIILTGEAGAGKTAILASLYQALRQTSASVALLTPGDPLPPRSSIVLMDDAHLLDAEALSQLTTRSRPCVLAALPSIQRQLPTAPRLVVVEIPAVPSGDVPALLAGLLRRNNERPSLLSPGSMSVIGRYAAGVPGRMCTMMKLAIFIARLEGVATVEPRHVERAVELDEEDAPPVAPVRSVAPSAAGQARFSSRIVAWPVALGLLLLVAVPASRLVEASKPVEQVVVALPAVPAASAPPHPVPAPAAAPVVFPLPVAPLLHVVLVVAGSGPDAQSRSAALALALEGQGYDMAAPRVVPASPSTTELRYFFSEDAAAAQRLARLVGIGPAAVRLAPFVRGDATPPRTAEILAAASFEAIRAVPSESD